MTTLSYLAAVIGSLILHALVVVIMTGHWQKNDTREIRPQIQVVKAQLIELEAKSKPAKPKTEVIDLTAQREKERKAEEARKLAQRKRNEEEKRKLEEQRRKDEARKKEQAEKERLAEEKRKQEVERQKKQREQQRISDFEDALKAEEDYQDELQEQQIVGSVLSEIVISVESNWSPPPSARRGMQAVLRFTLVPTGGLSSFEVVESSGDAAFDRSVTQAVQKAAPFEMVKEISPSVFERNLRTFLFTFNPTSLRL